MMIIIQLGFPRINYSYLAGASQSMGNKFSLSWGYLHKDVSYKLN